MQQSRYELIRHLAAGGMGEVFVARLMGAGDFEKRVALKLMQPHLVASEDLVSRFYAEARLAARMHHPNIVEIFDVGDADGRPFIAMQLVDGVSAAKLVRRLRHLGQRIPLPLARLVAVGLCEALTYAHTLTDGQGHSLKVVHRDVTPSNILLSRAGAVLLTDFGIARVHDGHDLTEPGVLRGKVAYLAPEQVLHSAPVDARTDLYSAALTLYELVGGDNPLRGATPQETLQLVPQGLPPLATLRPDVTPGLAAAMARALKPAPDDRFPTVRAFREAVIDGPVATAPELATYIQQHFGDELSAMDGGNERSETGSYVSVTPTAIPAAQRASPAQPSEDVTTLAPELVVGGPPPRRTPPTTPMSATKARLRTRSDPSRPAVSKPNLARTSQPKVSGVRSSAPRVAQVRPAPAPTRWQAFVATLAVALVLGGATGWILLKVRTEQFQPVAVEPAAAETAAGPTAPPVAAVKTPGPPASAEPARSEKTEEPDAGLKVEPTSARNPSRPAVRPPRAEPAPRVEPPPSRVDPATTAVDGPRFGFITVDADPWADVYEGSTLVERTPFARHPVTAGQHTLTFKGPQGKTVVRTIVVTADEVTPVRVQF